MYDKTKVSMWVVAEVSGTLMETAVPQNMKREMETAVMDYNQGKSIFIPSTCREKLAITVLGDCSSFICIIMVLG